MSDGLEQHKVIERSRRSRARLEPIVEISGVIPVTGASRVKKRGEPAEEVVVFNAWRVGQGPVELRNIRLVQEEIDDDLPFGSLGKLSPGTVVIIKARVVRLDDDVFGLVAGQARIATPDAAFTEVLERLKTPDTVHDARLGKLTADPLLGWVCRAEWLGRDCELMLTTLDSLTTAHALWEDQARWTRDASQFAAAKLIDLKNANWLVESQSPMTATEFQDRIRLACIAIRKDGAFDLEFDDGDLFWGHAIIVHGNLRCGLTRASVVG